MALPRRRLALSTVLAVCPGIDGPNYTDLQQRTIAASHELTEAATDPHPNKDAAYLGNDQRCRARAVTR